MSPYINPSPPRPIKTENLEGKKENKEWAYFHWFDSLRIHVSSVIDNIHIYLEKIKLHQDIILESEP